MAAVRAKNALIIVLGSLCPAGWCEQLRFGGSSDRLLREAPIPTLHATLALKVGFRDV